MSRLKEFYQKYQAFFVYAILLIILTLSTLGAMFLYNFKKIWNCLFIVMLFFALQSCKTIDKGFLVDTTKTFTKAKIKELYPKSNLEKDSIVLINTFKKTELDKKLGKAQKLFKQEGNVQLKWHRVHPDSVQIEIHYYNKSPQIR